MSSSGDTLPDWISALRGLAIRIQSRGLTGAIVSIVLGTFVTIFVIRPVEYAVAYIALAADVIGGAFTAAQEQVAQALEPVAATFLGGENTVGVIDMVYGSVEGVLMDAGLGAPFAATLTAVVFASVLTVVVYVVIRVLLDLIPGGGAFT